MEEKIQEKTVEEPKKKGKGCLIAIVITLLLLVGLCVGIYLTYKKIITSIGSPKDLGVTYSMQDVEESFSELGFSGDMCLDCATPIYSQPRELEATMTSSQASAWINYSNHDLPYGEISDMQVKFDDDNVQVSALFEYQGKEYPVFISGNGGKASEKTITGSLDTLQVAGVSLPSYVKPLVENILLQLANEKLSNMGDNLRIDTLEVTKEGLQFEGLAPSVLSNPMVSE